MTKKKIQLEVCGDDPEGAYLYLPDHPKKIVPGIVKNQKRLFDLIEDYKGPDIYLDFDENDILIGIEVI